MSVRLRLKLGACRCNGDATLLWQVFSNLIGNSVKFSRDHHPARIAVGTLQEALFASDNDVGFDNDYADQLFER